MRFKNNFIYKVLLLIMGICIGSLCTDSYVQAVYKQVCIDYEDTFTVVIDNGLKYNEVANNKVLKEKIKVYDAEGNQLNINASVNNSKSDQKFIKQGEFTLNRGIIGYKIIELSFAYDNNDEYSISVVVFCNGYISINYGYKENVWELFANNSMTDTEAVDEPGITKTNAFYNRGFVYEQCSCLTQISSLKPVKKNQYFSIEYSFNKDFKKVFATSNMCINKGEKDAYYTRFDIMDRRYIEVDYDKISHDLQPLFFPKKRCYDGGKEYLYGILYARIKYLGKKGVVVTDAAPLSSYRMKPLHNSVLSKTHGGYFDFSANGIIMIDEDKDFSKRNKYILKLGKKLKKRQSVYYKNDSSNIFYCYIDKSSRRK